MPGRRVVSNPGRDLRRAIRCPVAATWPRIPVPTGIGSADSLSCGGTLPAAIARCRQPSVFIHHPDLSEGNIGTSYGPGDEFFQQLFERQLVRGVEEHLHRVVRIEAAVARWFHAAKGAMLRTICPPHQWVRLFVLFDFSNRVVDGAAMFFIVFTLGRLRLNHRCWHGACKRG